MPKQKTKKSLAKRFKVTKNGKVLHRHSFTSHLKSNKSSTQKRRLAGTGHANKSFAKRIRKFLGVTAK
jgi:large subunit ribosomal protein L35